MRQAQKGAHEKDVKQVDRYRYKLKHNTNKNTIQIETQIQKIQFETQ